MNTIEYKGFNIVEMSARFYVTVVGSKSRGAAGFNADGYATLGGAKGAITKQIVHADAIAAGLAKLKNAVAVATEVFEALDIKVPDEGDVLMQKLTYDGLIKHGKAVTSQKYLSRNKREGRFTGKKPGGRYPRVHMETAMMGSY
jgi:hypothetical protein